MNILRRYQSGIVDQESLVKPGADVPVEPDKKKRNRRRVPFSNEANKPWEAEGVSRATWYVRRRIQKEREEAEKKALRKPVKQAPKVDDDPW